MIWFYLAVYRQISFICCDDHCRDLIYGIKPFIMGERNIVDNTLFFCQYSHLPSSNVFTTVCKNCKLLNYFLKSYCPIICYESLNSSYIDYKTSKCPFYNKWLFTERARGIHLLILHYQESLREKKRFTYKRNWK